MTHPKLIKTSSTNKHVILLVKILFVLIILLLLPQFVTSKRKRTPPKRNVLEARKLRQHCETTVCAAYILEENLNCISACLSPACFDQVYGQDPLQDGELDFIRAKAFDECFLEETRNAKRRKI